MYNMDYVYNNDKITVTYPAPNLRVRWNLPWMTLDCSLSRDIIL